MSKLCGILSKDSNCPDIIPNVVVKMLRLLNRTINYRTDKWCDNYVGLGHLSLQAVNVEKQPIFDGQGRCIILAGRIFDYNHLKLELITKGYNFQYPHNDAEFLLHFYKEFRPERLKELNGIFSAAIWDSNDKELTLINDRYGFRPLYYYMDETRGIFLFASEIKALIGSDFVERLINWEAWNVFLRLNFLLQDDTFFSNIFALQPATILRIKGTKIQKIHYWNYNQIELRPNFDQSRDIPNLVDLFKQAIKRRISSNGKALVLLSGGLDSRLIAAELYSQNVDFVTYTSRKFSPSYEDPILANKVARRLGVENHLGAALLGRPKNRLKTVSYTFY